MGISGLGFKGGSWARIILIVAFNKNRVAVKTCKDDHKGILGLSIIIQTCILPQKSPEHFHPIQPNTTQSTKALFGVAVVASISSAMLGSDLAVLKSKFCEPSR